MMSTDPGDRFLREMESVKKLIILDLVAKGHAQADIAATLGIGQSTISEMFPKGVLSKARKIKSRVDA